MQKFRKKRGQGLVEYALIFALMSLAAVLALTNLGSQVVSILYSKVQANLQNSEQIINQSSSTPGS
jgi:Flp pilus assembly pilin Flp